MLRSLRHSFRLYFSMVSFSIRAQLEYPYAFVMNILGWAMNYAGTAITMWVLLFSFQTIQGWTFWELLFLFALSVLSWGLCIIFFFHFRSLDQYILNGTFDRFLIRPIHPFMHFMASKFDVGAFGHLLFSIMAFVLAYRQLGLSWSLVQWLIFLAALLGGVLIQGGILIFISALAFWTTRSESFYWVIMFPAANLLNYPLSIYPKGFQWAITFILPYAFINYLPALLLLGKADSSYPSALGLLSLPAGIVFFAICVRLWLQGLSHYKSTGS
jgi:ABC-2 type transport system permease protein